MNNLSWILYLSDTLPAVGNSIALISAIAVLISIIGLIAHLTLSSSYSEEDQMLSQNLSFTKKTLPAALALLILTNVIPSKETFYLIAASESGEEMLKSPEMVKVRKVINEYLDDIIKEQD